MEPASLIPLLKYAQPLFKPFVWVGDKAGLVVFRIRSRFPWIDSETAAKRAAHFLGGNVIKAIPFRNYKSKRKYLAVLRKELPESYSREIYLLEKIGGSFVVVWSATDLICNEESLFSVDDIQRQGAFSISFAEESFGSGFGSRQLRSYCSVSQKETEITENYNYSNAAAPPYTPDIVIEGDERSRERFIRYAEKNGFLVEHDPPDLDHPDNIVIRWHRDNGQLIHGKVNITKYPGKPNIASSYEVKETDKSEWIACFKGPLYRYDKQQDEHYIVYSPQDVYLWVTAMFASDSSILFSCHCTSGLFGYSVETQALTRFCSHNGRSIEGVNLIEKKDGGIVLHEYDDVYPIEISKLERCAGWCAELRSHNNRACTSNPVYDEQV